MTRRALFIASAKTGPELKSGAADCRKIHSVLTAEAYGGHDSELSAPPLIDCENEETFLFNITRFFKTTLEADQRIVYFTGHGRVSEGEYGFVFNDGSDFVPFGALVALLRGRGVGKTLFILDTCYSGAADLGGLKSQDLLYVHTSGSCVLASSKDIELSHEDPAHGSIFTHYLCECITSGYDGQRTPDGLITVPEACTFIKKRLVKLGDRSVGVQTPRYSIRHAEGPLWIAKNSTGAIVANPSDVPTSKSDKERYSCPGSSIDDLDEETIRAYAQPEFDPAKYSLLELAKYLDLFFSDNDDRPNEAAILCFGKRPHKFFPNAISMFSAGDRTSSHFAIAHTRTVNPAA
jgi:hypothetical protein